MCTDQGQLGCTRIRGGVAGQYRGHVRRGGRGRRHRRRVNGGGIRQREGGVVPVHASHCRGRLLDRARARSRRAGQLVLREVLVCEVRRRVVVLDQAVLLDRRLQRLNNHPWGLLGYLRVFVLSERRSADVYGCTWWTGVCVPVLGAVLVVVKKMWSSWPDALGSIECTEPGELGNVAT